MFRFVFGVGWCTEKCTRSHKPKQLVDCKRDRMKRNQPQQPNLPNALTKKFMQQTTRVSYGVFGNFD